MEIRHDYDTYTKWLSNGLGYISNAEAVFQQKDLSSLPFSATDTYARILIKSFSIYPGETYHHDEYPQLSAQDYPDLNEMVETEAYPYSLIENPSWKIINFGGNKAIEGIYRRTGQEGPVSCRLYLLSNYSEMVKIIIAYRNKDSEIWEEDLNKVITTFKWKNPK